MYKGFVNSLLFLSTFVCCSASAVGWHHGFSIGLSKYQASSDIQFYDQTKASNRSLSAELTAETSAQLMHTLVGFEGYSISSDWAFSYALEQFKVTDTATANNSTYAIELKGLSAEMDAGLAIIKFKNGLRLYGLAGVRYLTHKFDTKINLVEQAQLKADQFQLYTGLRLDMPLYKSLVLHIKADAAIADDTYSRLSAGLNYRLTRHLSLVTEAELGKLELSSGKDGQTDYYNYDGDLNKLSIKAVYIW